MPRSIDVAYHLVDARNWASVQANGLSSASRLMEAAGEAHAGTALRRHRPTSCRLSSGAVIRDQGPMPPGTLARCLRDGLQPEDWYELLNGKVFFWLDPERLNRQRLACGAAPQIALVIDAQALLAVHGDATSVSAFNTGNAMRAAAPRNRSTFVPYRRWAATAWADERVPGSKPRPASHRPVELTVADAVPDVMRFITGAAHLGPGETLTTDLRGGTALRQRPKV